MQPDIVDYPMNLKGYSIEDVAGNVETLLSVGYDEEPAIQISFSIARSAYKLSFPDKGLPDYLYGRCRESLREFMEGGGEE